MLTPHEFKRTRAARPRPDLGGDDLADLGTTGWYVGRFSTDKHLSIGKAHAVRPKIGLYWPPVVARVGRRPWRCRCGLLYWWPPVLADAVGRPPWWRPSVWLAGVLAGGPCRWCPSAVLAVGPWLVSVRGRGGRFRGRWRPFGRPLVHWSAVVLSWPVAALFWALPVVGRRGPCWLVCLPFQLVVFRRRLWPVAAGVRCWSLRALLRRRWSRWPCRWPSLLNCWCRCHCAVPWPVVRVAGRQYWPPCGGVLVGVIAPSRGGPCAVVRPSVLVSAVVGRWPCPSVLAGVLVCGRWLASVYCRVPWPWRPFRAVGGAGVRRWSLRPVWAVFWALPTGWPCGPCQWLAAVAGGACACGGACLVNERWPVAGWRWAVCGAFRGGGVRLPCLWSLLVSRQRRPWPSVYQRTKHQRPPWRPCWWCVLLACAGVGGVGVGGYILAPVGPRTAAVGRCAVGVTY